MTVKAKRAKLGLRVSIALDNTGQVFMRDGVIGVTISSRTATAKDHGHTWGKVGEWLLNHIWPFSLDMKKTGISHGTLAEMGDCLRAVEVLREILGDNVVVEKRNFHEFRKVIISLVNEAIYGEQDGQAT